MLNRFLLIVFLGLSLGHVSQAQEPLLFFSEANESKVLKITNNNVGVKFIGVTVEFCDYEFAKVDGNYEGNLKNCEDIFRKDKIEKFGSSPLTGAR